MTKHSLPIALLAVAGLAGCGHAAKVSDETTKASHASNASTNPAALAAAETSPAFFEGKVSKAEFESFWRMPATTEPPMPPLQKHQDIKAEKAVFPAQKDLSKLRHCGELLYPESNRFVTDQKEVHHFMQLDCNHNGVVDSGDGEHLVQLEGVKPQQKGWFTRWRQAAATEFAQKYGRVGVPFICFQAAASADPCASNNASVISNANFTSVEIGKIVAKLKADREGSQKAGGAK